IFAFIVLNGVFVMSELAIASSRKARLQQRINEGDDRAETVLKLNQDPNMFLATVQIGITLISVLIGAVGGARLSEPLSRLLVRVPFLAPYAESVSLSIVVIALTIVSIVIGELLPKRLALHNPESVASMLAGPMTFISKILTPLVWMFGFVTDSLLRI